MMMSGAGGRPRFCGLFCLLLLLVSGTAGPARAEYCPGKISAILGTPLSAAGALRLKQVYKRLGCTPEIVFLPGRRAVAQFNSGLVDGELYRLRLIEGKYHKLFVRSSVPLYKLVTALWAHPDPHIALAKPYGYVLGVGWQEKFVATPVAGDRVHFISYHDNDEVLNAYNRGAIGGFLAEKQQIDLRRRTRTMDPEPVLVKTIASLPLFHYLDRRYEKFMVDFSAEIRRDNPFRDFD